MRVISVFSPVFRRALSRLFGMAGAFLFSLALAGCGGGSGGGGFLGDSGGNVGGVSAPGTDAVLGSGEITETRRQAVAAKVAGLDLGGGGAVGAEDVQVSEDPAILNQNPFATPESAPAAEARGFVRQSAGTERKTPGYKAFEVAVPADNPLMTVAVWISETAPEEEVEYPEGKPERDPEAPRKFLYVRLQVYVSTGNFAAVENGGVEVLETKVIVVEERLPDPKPPAGAEECENAGWKAARVDGNAINCQIPLTSDGVDFPGCVLSGEFEPLCSEVFGADFSFPTKLGEEARYVFNCGEGMIPEGSNTIGATQCFAEAAVNCTAGSLPAEGMTQADLNVALRLSARRGDAAQVCEMLRRGAEVNDDLSGTEFTALQEAVSGGHLAAAELLLANGANVNARKEGTGPSPLDLAARAENAEIAAVLRAAAGRCFLESGGLCEEAVAEGSCPAGTLSADGMTQAQLDARMISAAEDGDADAVCEYLRRGADVEAQKTGNLRTALMVAGEEGHADVVELLLENGADVNRRGGNGGYGGRPNPGRWSGYPDSNWPALLYASSRGHADVVRIMLENGADVELGDDRKRRPLWEAAFYGHQDVMELLLDNGADVDVADAWGVTPLHAPGPHYGYPGDLEWNHAANVAKYLLSRGANVNARDTWGRSPLDLYAGWNHPNAAAVLRAAGGVCFVETGPLCEVEVAAPEPVIATVVASDTICTSGSLSADGMTQAELDAGMMDSIFNNDLEGVCEYLRRGANIAAHTADGHTALIMVQSNLEMAKLLLANGADPNQRESLGARWPPVMFVRQGAEVIALYLSHGADPNAGVLSGNSWKPLHEAAYYNEWRIMEALVSGGADPDVWALRRNWEGTPLHYAARHHSGHAVSVLLAAGAEMNPRGSGNSYSPLDEAVWRGNDVAARMLRDAGGVCFVKTGPFCEVEVAAPEPVVATVVTSDTICTAGTLSANGKTQAQLDAGLISAARGNDLAEVCEYLRRGANVDAQESEWRYYKRTALMIAATDGNLELGKLLHHNGADVNLQAGNYNNPIDASHYQGNRRMPALHYAAGAGRKDFVEWLLSEGANVRALQALPRDALWEAAFWGRPEIVRILLTAGADANKLATGENLALWDAVHHPTHWAKYGNPRWGVSDAYARPTDEAWTAVISILVANGADVNVREPQGASPLDIAARRGNAYYAELMREYGSRCFVETGPLCGVEVATPEPVVATVVTRDTICTAGSLSANGLTQAELNAGLISAAGDGDLTTACEYLRRGASPNARDAHQHVPLMHANAHLDMGELLLKNGADKYVLIDGNGWWSPLFPLYGIYTAAQIEFYLSRGVDPNFGSLGGDEYDWRPLHEAAYYGKWNAIKHLLDGGALPNVHTTRPGWRGRTPLHEAVGTSSDSFHFAIDAGNPPFGMIVGNSARAVSVLLAGGAEVNALDGRGYSPLDRAAAHSKTAAAAVLRAAGGKCFVQTGPLCEEVPAPVAVVSTVVASDTICTAGTLPANGMTQAQLDAGLISAAKENDLPKVCEHLRRGADIEARENTQRFRRTALMIAASDGFLDLAKLLYANGANVNRQAGNHRGGHNDSPGWSALHYAATAGHANIVSWLLDSGADADARWGWGGVPGKSVLWEAAFWGRADVVEILLSHGADPEGGGHPLPLHGAATKFDGVASDFVMVNYSRVAADSEGYVKVVSLLASRAPDVNRRAGNNWSALDIAAHHGQTRIAGVLRDFGGRCFVKTGPLCEVATATPDPAEVIATVVANDALCPSGSLSANGMTARQLTDGLVSATEENDLPKICEYLRRGANVEAIESGRCYSRTPLMIAANDGNLDAAKLLRANGANVNRLHGDHICGRGKQDWSALMYAAAAGHLEMSRWLLDSGAEIDARWSQRKTALWEAAYWGRPEVVRLLISRGAAARTQDAGGNTALRILLHGGAISYWVKSSWQYKRDALSYSYPNPSVDANVLVISLLADAGADVNNVLNGRSILDDAVSRDFSRFAEILRSFGAECRAETGPLCGEEEATPVASDTICAASSLSANGMTQAQLNAGLISAAEDNNLPGICEYLRRGANIEAQKTGNLRTALMIAALDGHADVAELLINNGADVNYRGGNGGYGGRPNPGRWRDYPDSNWPALLYAAGWNGNVTVARLLLDNSANIELGDDRNRRPLWEAAFNGHLDMMELLLDRGADVNGADVWGITPLHAPGPHYGYPGDPEWPYAAEVAEYLISRGANVNALDTWGRSPLDLYAGWNHPNAAAVVREAGGKCFVQTGPLCGEAKFAVEYSSSANGTVSADVASGREVSRGTTVAFTATPAEGWYVSEWTGSCANAGAVSDGLDGTAKVCSVSADAALSVGAVFAEVPSLAGTDCPSGSLPANGMTQAQLDANLVSAADEGDLAKACEYLRRGASPNGRGADQSVPLMRAKANLDMGNLLLENGADEYVLIDGNGWWSPLFPLYGIYTAAQIEFYLSRGVDPNFGSLGGGDHGWRPLHEAAYYGKWNAIKHLLDGGALPNVHTTRPGWRGRTPLHEAVGTSSDSFHFAIDAGNPPFGMIVGNSARAVSVLLAGGAEVNALDGRGYSPLDRAAAHSKTAAAAVLRAAGGRCFVRTGPLCGEAKVAVEYSSSANGTVSADVESGGEVPRGTMVAFTATPAEGWYVSEWTGSCANAAASDATDGAAKVCSVTADSDLNVGAVFAEILSLAGPECPAGTMPANGLAQAELNAQLRLAARNGNTRKICEMLRRGAEVNDNLDGNEFTALQEAVSGEHQAAAEMLLANNAEVNARKGGSGPAPLDLAAQNENAEIAQILRDANGQCFVETGPLCGDYVPAATLDPSTIAVTATTTATVAIEDLTCPTEPLSAEGWYSESGLRRVMLRSVKYPRVRDYERVCRALRQGADPNGYVDSKGNTPLHRVFERTERSSRFPDWKEVKLAMAKLLIDWGADVNALNNPAVPPGGRGVPPLYVAMHEYCSAHLDLCEASVKLLLDAGADVNLDAGTVGHRPLHILAARGDISAADEESQASFNRIAAMLIRAGADVNAKKGNGYTPLHDIFSQRPFPDTVNMDLVKALIDAGADVNAKSRIGWTPLHAAIESLIYLSAEPAIFEGIKFLVANGADVNLESNDGKTPAQFGRYLDISHRVIAWLEDVGSPVAVIPESDAVPESVTEELQEDFQAAFSPASAFGDAFGAAASPGRLLTRLDSLMRGASGSGNVWDSFSGWQGENNFGRVWFSTGQRGDFGFGAEHSGGSGFGKVLDANPFAALSGNGMLAGGETGFGESGKLRVAAFGDYESRSLLTGEDGKWTRWAASGTAIETAMSEAERFSGLSENKTRGAMTEFHLGGADAGVALQAGAVSESESALGGTARNESLRGLRSRTAFAGLSGSAALPGTGWRLRGAAHVGRSWAESDGMLRASDLWASAFSAGLERGGWLYSDDGFVLRFSQPLRVEIWERELANDNGVRRMGIAPSGRQLDIDAAYRLPLSGGGWLLFSAGVRRDGGHSSDSGLEGGALFAVEKGF